MMPTAQLAKTKPGTKRIPKLGRFPIFKKLNTKDILLLNTEIHNYDSRSDYAPAYIQCFNNVDEKLGFCRLNTNLVTRYYDPEVKELLYTLQGSNKLAESILEIFEFQNNNGFKQKISHIDESQAKQLKNSRTVHLIRDHESEEYIIKTQTHADLKDPRIKDEAMHIRSFIRKYGNDIKIFEPDLSNPRALATIINSWHVWQNHHKNNNNDPEAEERKHISTFFSDAHNLPSRCLVISYADQIVGFTIFDIYEHLSTAGGHFMKVDYAYNHAFDFMVHALCSKLYTEGIKYINIENDLGIPGIRYKKQSLLPVKMLKFYTATPK